jgi:prepilin-type N-terminal cleavage/methylation domain-containing protein
MDSAKDFNSKIKTTRILGMRNGFTLIELVIVMVLIGILAAGAVLMFGSIITQQQFDATVKEMNELKMANLGNPDLVQSGTRTSFGFVGDMGALPSTLGDLVSTAQTWFTTAVYHAGAGFPDSGVSMPDLGTGAGRRGPYIDNKTDDSATPLPLATLDGWGNPYQYPSPGAGQVTSYGPDEAAGGGDDITIPETSPVITGGITGTVRGNQGNPVEGATVRIYFPNGSGVHTTAGTTTAADGTYFFPTIPIGRRTIRVISGTSPNWVIINDTVVVDGNQTVTKNFTIADMIAPTAPTWANAVGSCTVNGAYPVKTNQINLTWNASTSPDVAGYKLYRGTAAGAEVLYRSVTGISYADTPISANTTYYYRLSAVDTAGNESAPIANPTGGTPAGSRIAGPIYKGANAIWINNDEVRFPTTNSGISNIVMTNGVYQMIVTWSGGASTRIRRVRVGGTTVRDYGGGGCGTTGATNGNFFTFTVSYTYNCAVNQNIDVRFCGGNDDENNVTSITAQLGGAAAPFDGVLTCTGGPPCQ